MKKIYNSPELTVVKINSEKIMQLSIVNSINSLEDVEPDKPAKKSILDLDDI